MGYSRAAIKGVSWLGTFRAMMRSFSYLKLAIIARILSPSQFGISDIPILILALVEVITETGINIFLIQERENINKYINTAWIVSIIRGFFIAIAIFVFAPVISSFFKSPASYPLIILVCLVPILRGFINPSVANFLKELRYQREFYYRLTIFIVESVTTVLLVVYLKHPVGIIWGLVAGAIYELILSIFR